MGAGGREGDGGRGGETASKIDVEGVLVYEEGEPVAGATVVLPGSPPTYATTALDGSFRFSDVVAPYDLAVLNSPEWSYLEFKELTHAAPRIVLTFDWWQEFGLRGQVRDPAFPLSPDKDVFLGLAAYQTVLGPHVDPYNGEVSSILKYRGPWFVDGSLVGVLASKRAGGGFEFHRAGSVDVRFAALDEVEIDLELSSPVATQTTTVIFDPSAYSFPVLAYLGSFTILGSTMTGHTAGPLPSSPAVLPIPTEGGTIALIGFDDQGREATYTLVPAVPDGVTRVSLPATKLQLEIVQPLVGATVDSSPVLEWSAVPGASAYRVELYAGEGNERVSARWFVPAGTTKITIPDLGTGGFQLPRGFVEWMVEAHTLAGFSPEDLADPAGPGAPPPWWHPNVGHAAHGSFTIVR